MAAADIFPMNGNGLEEVGCPVCGAAGESQFALRDWFCGLPGEFGERHCGRCDVFFLSPRVPEALISRYYPESYSAYTADQTPLWIRLLSGWVGLTTRRLRMVEHHLRGGSILDVGCGNGWFLNLLRSPQWQCYAMDIAVNPAVEKGLGVPVFTGQFDHEKPPLADLDAITLWHVFEHLYHPRRALQHAQELLRDRGFLFITVPDLVNIDRRIFGRYWVGWDAPRHLALYSKQALERLLGEAGFHLVAVRPAPYTGDYFLMNLDFLMAKQGRRVRPSRWLPPRLAIAPALWGLARIGLAPVKMYVAQKN